MLQRLTRHWSVITLVVALGLMLVLVQQNARWEDRYVKLQRWALEPHGGLLLPTFSTTTLDGTPVTVGERPDGGRQLLFVFTTTCPYCRASIPAWKHLASLADTLSSPRFATYGIVLDSATAAQRYVTEHALPYPIVRFPSRKLGALYRTRSVPLTMVMDSGGRVLYARQGVLTEQAVIDSVVHAMRWQRPNTPDLAER